MHDYEKQRTFRRCYTYIIYILYIQTVYRWNQNIFHKICGCCLKPAKDTNNLQMSVQIDSTNTDYYDTRSRVRSNTYTENTENGEHTETTKEPSSKAISSADCVEVAEAVENTENTEKQDDQDIV